MSKPKGFTNHIYAESKDEALEITRRQYPHHVIGEASLDPDWRKTTVWKTRWAVKVSDRPKDRPAAFQNVLNLLEAKDYEGLKDYVVAGLSNVNGYVCTQSFLQVNHFYKYHDTLFMIAADDQYGKNARILLNEDVEQLDGYIGFSQRLESIDTFNLF